MIMIIMMCLYIYKEEWEEGQREITWRKREKFGLEKGVWKEKRCYFMTKLMDKLEMPV